MNKIEKSNTRDQEVKLFKKSFHPKLCKANRQFCHPELDSGSKNCRVSLYPSGDSGSVHSEKWKLPWDKMLKQVQHDKWAFTLAEVLITLGIIGVVAVITIPNLISNYQKRAWVGQLQKSYATLNQGFRRMLADDDATALSQTETFNSIVGEERDWDWGQGKFRQCSYSNGIDSDNCKEFYRNLGKYFKIADIRKFTNSDKYRITDLNGNRLVANYYTGTVITLMDGTMIFKSDFFSQDQNGLTDNQMKGIVGSIFIDVNGTKRPNKMGRDIFYFYLGDNGIVYPYGSMAVSEYFYQFGDWDTIDGGYWKTMLNNREGNDTCAINKDESEDIVGSASCAARVLEEGKMNY